MPCNLDPRMVSHVFKTKTSKPHKFFNVTLIVICIRICFENLGKTNTNTNLVEFAIISLSPIHFLKIVTVSTA